MIGIGVAATILILVIIWLLVGRRAQYTTQITATPQPTTFVTPEVATQPAQTPVATQAATPGASQGVVTITSAGFSPATIEIERGGTVIWLNNDVVAAQIASTPHPVHSDYPPLNSVGTLQAGQSRSLLFGQTGTYRYHNHLNPGVLGRVVVK